MSANAKGLLVAVSIMFTGILIEVLKMPVPYAIAIQSMVAFSIGEFL